ncbi:DUF1127 domain-containing protein [Endozoicomonadaceae bacterium StTr2]
MKESDQQSGQQQKKGILTLVIRNLKIWHQRSAGRKQVAALSDYMLKDIGLSRYDANKEYAKPFWMK